jgi:hypothetical protein
MWASLATISLTFAILAMDAGTASATLLCSVPSCLPLETYPADTAVVAGLEEGTQAQLLSSLGTVTCKSSAIAGKTTAQIGKPLPLEVSQFAFGECKLEILGGKECTVTTISLPTSPSFEATGEGNGTLNLTGGETNVHCGIYINCTYVDPALAAKGGKPATLSTKETTLTHVGGGLCPETGKLDVTYTVSKPVPAYLGI